MERLRQAAVTRGLADGAGGHCTAVCLVLALKCLALVVCSVAKARCALRVDGARAVIGARSFASLVLAALAPVVDAVQTGRAVPVCQTVLAHIAGLALAMTADLVVTRALPARSSVRTVARVTRRRQAHIYVLGRRTTQLPGDCVHCVQERSSA